ncbi:MAG: hypothetical protein A3C64_00850 [Candidatus Yanofskybacteria bacterium RIFCSPHIGHO2_02_FULL_41_12]|nr:MAG: hypothetical protein A3C64_00850 [Candidatus Yanofskybacteria bacterium RIFCSPHIGHO2_02_FULL_41_12]
MRKIRAIVVALVLLSASSASSFISAQSEKFGKNNVIWRDGEPNFYQSEHFDVWTWMDLKDPKQAEHFRKFMENIENACSFLGSKKMYDHILSKRLPIIVFNTHSEWASSALGGSFLPEGLGAYVESNRNRMVTKEDFLPQLKRAVTVHEMAHEFQMDLQRTNILKKDSKKNELSLGFYEGGAEFMAGQYEPHTRDDIRRLSQRMVAANPKSLPTWDHLKNDPRVNPYSMWEMVFEMLEAEFSCGVDFQVQGFKRRDISLGELIYQLTKGKLGNPDKNPQKFDEFNRDYWGGIFESDRIKRSKPYQENANVKGRNITPYLHPYPGISPMLSPDGKQIAYFTIAENGFSTVIVKYPIPAEEVFIEIKKPDDESDKKSNEKKNKQIVNLTPQFPPEPWEYIVSDFVTWPFNGRNGDWSRTGNKIAFFAQKNRDHALFIIDAEKPDKILQTIYVPFDQSFSPIFSPDGETVYFSAAEKITRDIYAIDLKSQKTVNLSNDERFDTAPAVSPDGKRIAYIGSDGDFQHIFILNLENGEKKQLTFGRFNDNSPSWSDDGATIVFTSDKGDQVWKIYTIDAASKTISQWTDYFGSSDMPIFARGKNDLIYYAVYRDDDEHKGFIYSNWEIFEALLLKPIKQFVAEDKGESTDFSFTDRNLSFYKLDAEQIENPNPSPQKWVIDGGDVNIGADTYWGMFGSSWFGWSNILDSRHHLFQFSLSGNYFRVLDYIYLNEEKRLGRQYEVYNRKYPFYYAFYGIATGRPRQSVIRMTDYQEFGATAAMRYPIDKFNRYEFYASLRNRDFSMPIGLDEEWIIGNPEQFNDQDLQMFRLLNNSSGSNLVAGAAFVRDTVFYSGITQGPLHGNAVRAQVEFAPPMGKEFKGFYSLSVDARTYRRLSSGVLLAGRISLFDSSKKAGDFVLMGGADMIRGRPYGSLVGNQIAYGSVELRFPIVDAVLFPRKFALGPFRGILFGDAGIAKFSGEKFPAQKGFSYGAGIQFLPFTFLWTQENHKWVPSFYFAYNW